MEWKGKLPSSIPQPSFQTDGLAVRAVTESDRLWRVNLPRVGHCSDSLSCSDQLVDGGGLMGNLSIDREFRHS